MNAPPMCYLCLRFDRSPPAGRRRCEAFPEGIPEEIFFEGADHRRPFADEDLTFAPQDEEAEAEVRARWGKRPRPWRPPAAPAGRRPVVGE